ncbi:hypothetical protein B2J93_7125 [Marssonina coronariae]|uniref:Uncharacterized protein n=1 Tax=Diplocarpon coronariae TaxID=2795749 RepID=A0A218YVV1_9HELO|nr:hypothetical protein B2J93_7125 [Marssonina coronariae]
MNNAVTRYRKISSSATADAQQRPVLRAEVKHFGQEAGDGILVADGALVPVVGDALVVWGVDGVMAKKDMSCCLVRLPSGPRMAKFPLHR